MKFASRKEGDVLVFDLAGDLVGGPDTYAIKDAAKEQLDRGERKFLFNLNQVGYLNSTGVGIIVSVYSNITSAGGAMKLCNANEKVSRLMMVTKLLEVFDSYGTEAEALRAFQTA